MRKKRWIRLFSLSVALLTLFTTVCSAEETGNENRIEDEPMYQSFTYTLQDGVVQYVEGPNTYQPTGRVNGESLGVSLLEPVDIFVRDSELYVVDKENQYIVHTNSQFKVLNIIKDFVYNGKIETFKQPEGVYVTADKVYIADTGNQRIVVLNRDGSCSSVITAPESDILSDSLVFAPQKVAADAKGRVYAVVKGVYEGIMELYEDGSFGGFVGSIPVTPDPLTQLWKSIMTAEQRAKLQKFVPVEYTNLALDSDGFVYTVSLASESVNAIRKLNAAGGDILTRNALHRIPINGVLQGGQTGSQVVNSSFVDIVPDENGMFFALDAEYGRVFGYDADGNLLFVMGNKNTGQNGTFQKASSLALLDGKVLVADSASADITVFERTVYAEEILKGIELYRADKYAESVEAWQEVLRYNSHFLLAYSKIGQAFYQMGEYVQAMEYFKRAKDQEHYSQAFVRWRDDAFSRNFLLIALGIVGVVVLQAVLRLLYKRWRQKHPVKKGSIFDSLTYPLYVIFHPFDGFWDLKYEKRGRTWVATLLVILTIITFAIERSLTGFSLIKSPGAQLDIIFELKFVLVPLALFLVANMSITTLMDGKGTFRQLYTATGYALTPLILIRLPMTFITNILSMEEAAYVNLLSVISILWVAVLVFAALSCTHEYTASKTVGTIALTGVAVVIICFICVLFFFLFTELIGFVYTLTEEMRYR